MENPFRRWGKPVYLNRIASFLCSGDHCRIVSTSVSLAENFRIQILPYFWGRLSLETYRREICTEQQGRGIHGLYMAQEELRRKQAYVSYARCPVKSWTDSFTLLSLCFHSLKIAQFENLNLIWMVFLLSVELVDAIIPNFWSKLTQSGLTLLPPFCNAGPSISPLIQHLAQVARAQRRRLGQLSLGHCRFIYWSSQSRNYGFPPPARLCALHTWMFSQAYGLDRR